MDQTVNTIIDAEKCIGCGMCAKVCPFETITMVDGKACVTGSLSTNCGHCMAACPVEAVHVTSLHELELKTITFDKSWIRYGGGNASELIRLLASRRSCRNFIDKPVDQNILEDLVAIATTAPSGSNAQEWTFTVLEDKAKIQALGNHVVSFFRKLNKMAGISPLRAFMSLIGKPELQRYYERYYERVSEKIRQWEGTGKDFVFHSAQALIVVGATDLASCPSEDALLATQNIILAAHTMGLGTCLIGFAVQAIKRDKGIAKLLGIPENEEVYAVIALGWPDEGYAHIAPRKKILARFPAMLL